jgi:LuxR family maltose regulon positive regulatory protein
MARKPAQVREDWLLNPRADGCDLRLDTPTWFAWLEAPESRSFAYGLFDPHHGWIAGFMTVRKDRRQRGGWYWSVFRRQGSRMRRFYLGRAEQVTAARLAGIAQQLLAEVADQE